MPSITGALTKARNYNLDIKNPHIEHEDHGDLEELLAELNNAEVEIR